MLALMHQYIGGQRRDAGTGETFDVLDPSTNETLETVTLAGHDDVDAAVAAAGAAFQEWSRATPVERSTVLLKAAALLDERAEELARLESRQAGKPIRLAREFDVPGTVDNTAFFGAAARRLDGMASGRVLRRPHVVGPARADRRRRVDRAVELPAADGGVEGAAGHRRRQHHRAQARRDHPADQPGLRRGRSPRPAPPPASSTSSPAPGRSPASTWSATPTSR